MKLTLEQFDATIGRVFHELDPIAAAEWRVLGENSARLNSYVRTAREHRFGEDVPQEVLRGFLVSGLKLGYELAKTEAANERAQMIEKSEALA